MAFNKEQLIKRLDSLNLPKGKYVLIAGGAMVMHGLRKETNDLDLSVDYDLYKKIMDGHHDLGPNVPKRPTYPSDTFKQREIIHVSDDIEISSGGKGLICSPPVELDGHMVQAIPDIHAFKSKMNRPKDQADLEVLKAAMEQEKRLHPKPEFKRKDLEFIKRKTPRGSFGRAGKF